MFGKDAEAIDRAEELCYLLGMLTNKISLLVVGLALCCLFMTGCQSSLHQAGGAPPRAGMAFNPTSRDVQNGQWTAADDYRNALAYPGRF
jgi:hypothetical protein